MVTTPSTANTMLMGKTHNQTSGFSYVCFDELKRLPKQPLEVTAKGIKGAKSKAPICAPHNAEAKTKDAVLSHNAFTMLWADIDAGNQTLAHLMGALAAAEIASYVIYATSSSAPADKRWRVMVEISEPAPVEQWEALQVYLATLVGGAPEGNRVAQIMYLPFKWAGTKHYEYHTQDGEALNPFKSHFAKYALEAQAERDKVAQEAAERAAKEALEHSPRPSFTANQESAIALYNGSVTLKAEMVRYGYRFVSKWRAISPYSTSGTDGVVLFKDAERFYSHHDSDPETIGGTHSHDAFDLLTHFEHGDSVTDTVKRVYNTIGKDANKQRQREYAQRKAAEATTPSQAGGGDNKPPLFSDVSPYDVFAKWELPNVPKGVFPAQIWDYCQDQAQLIGADPLAMAIFCLGVAAGVIDDRIKIQPKRHDTSWRESARLWVGVIGDPSTIKSPLLSKALAPAFAINKRWRAERAKLLAQWEEEKESAIKNGSSIPDKPLTKLLLINDATVEKISSLLGECEPRGVLSYQDELSGWLGSMDAYKGGAGGKDKPAWLEAYNGGTKFFDRVRRGEIYVENWSVSLVGGIQPQVIHKYANSTDNDGLLQRFMLIHAKQNRSMGMDRPANAFAMASYHNLIEHLSRLTASNAPVTLTEGAHRHREALAGELHTLVLNHPSKMLVAALGKWRGLFARLLLIWHCCDAFEEGQHPTQMQVKPATAEMVALFMRKVLLPHALTFYEKLDPHEDNTKDLARLILAKGWLRFTRARDFNQQWKASRKLKPWEIDAVLERLEGYGWIAPDPNGGFDKNGNPKAYLVNKAVHEAHRDTAEEEKERRKAVAQSMAMLSQAGGEL